MQPGVTSVTIDIRMLHSSGIGTYIQNLIPLITASNRDSRFNLLADVSEIRQFAWSGDENVRLIECLSPVYSIAGQFELLRKIPKATSLFWSPHYNIPLLYRGKLAVTIHDVAHIAFPETAKGPHKQLYARTLLAAAARKADAIIFVSEFSRQEFIRHVGRLPELNYVIHNGISKDWFDVSKKQDPHKKPFLLFVGNVKPHKNITRLLNAFELILNRVPHDLVLAGRKEGFITGDSVALKKAGELAGRVHFTGELSAGLLKQYYAFADALVFPSLYEGFGLPPVEAMACGCPVVVSEAASLPEVCGDAAYYVDPYSIESIAEGMYKILTDRTLREGLIQKAIERAKMFSWEKSAREHIKVFEEVLNN